LKAFYFYVRVFESPIVCCIKKLNKTEPTPASFEGRALGGRIVWIASGLVQIVNGVLFSLIARQLMQLPLPARVFLKEFPGEGTQLRLVKRLLNITKKTCVAVRSLSCSASHAISHPTSHAVGQPVLSY
jgi:hypothetical protein